MVFSLSLPAARRLCVLAFPVLLAVLSPALPAHARQSPLDVGLELRIIDAPSRNFTAAVSRHIDTVVLHYSSGINVKPSHWADPALVLSIFRRYRVSAHYLIARDGQVYRLVTEQNIAWHAGGSIMPAPDNRRGVNRFSLGIELIATPRSGYTDAQYTALAALLRAIASRYPIRHIVGHDEIAGSRTVRLGLRDDIKRDPGPLFDWNRIPDRLSGTLLFRHDSD